MKTKLLIIFASAGAFFQTGAWAADAQIKTQSPSDGQPEASIELRANQSAGLHADASASQSHLKRASELIGMDIRNQQDEKLGDIKDVIVDLESGRAPFAVISSGGFFGVGDRLLAVPTTTFKQSAAQDQFTLNMDRERMKSAPSFDKNSWPDMNDETWSSGVYTYYDAQPISSSSVAVETTSQTQTEITEAAGADRSSIPGHSSSISQSFGETTTGLSRDRTPRQGLGAEDLTKNRQKIYNPGGYAESDAFFNEPAGAERTSRRTETTTIQEERPLRTGQTSALTTTSSGKVKRASELIGMEVKNAQNERIGEIKDVVIDLQSGRVAYTVLDPDGSLAAADKLFAVPPAVFTRASDERWLVLNTDKEMLKTSPSFEKNNWPQSNNQQFTTEVYRFYHQQPYWQGSGTIREPAGSELKSNEQQLNQQQRDQQQPDSSSDQSLKDDNQIQEPSGAAAAAPAPDAEIKSELNSASPQTQTQTQPERDAQPVGSPRGFEQKEDSSSAAKETTEAQSAQKDTQIQEAAGATTDKSATATDTATGADQSGSAADRQLSQKLRTSLETDTVLSSTAQKVKVSAADGKITLRGTVENEQQKQSIAAKAQQIAGSADKVDNQLKVGQSDNQTDPQSNSPSVDSPDTQPQNQNDNP